jgi:hypothetical protein
VKRGGNRPVHHQENNLSDEQARNEAGQFTSDGSDKFGMDHFEHQQGFERMHIEKPRDDEPGHTFEDNEQGIRQAAAELLERRGAAHGDEIDPISWRTEGGTGDPMPENQSVSLRDSAEA